MTRTLIAVALVGIAASVLAQELVSVAGSGHKFPKTIELQHGGQRTKLRLTGTGVRTKFLSIYAVGSYLQDGVSARTPAELSAVDCVKRLHLKFERDIPGDDMAESIRANVRRNYEAPEFDEEINAMATFLKPENARKGQEILLTCLPGIGLHIDLFGKKELTIKNPRYPRAIWDIYLGRNNLGEPLKKALVSRL